MKYKIIVDKQTQGNPSPDKREYEIDIEELRVKGDIYDSLIITQEEDYVIRRLKLSEYNVLSVLPEPIKEPIPNLNIELFEGDNYIYLADMTGNKFYAEYLINNDFNNTFATRGEMNSSINQTAQSIELSVNKKLEGYSTTEEMNSAINIKAGEITSSVSKTYATKGELNTTKSEIKQTTDGISTEVSKKVGDNEIISKINQSAEAVQINANKISLAGKEINLTGDNVSIKSSNLEIDKNGNMIFKNANGTSPTLKMTDNDGGKLEMYTSNFYMENNYFGGIMDIFLQKGGFYAEHSNGNSADLNGYTATLKLKTPSSSTTVSANEITTPKLNQTSLESIKKNIQKYEKNASKIIKNSDIYEYNLKSEKDTDKKQIGFIIGDNYRTPYEVINQENNAIVLYSAIGLLWKSNQEQQEEIELLKNKISELEAKING